MSTGRDTRPSRARQLSAAVATLAVQAERSRSAELQEVGRQCAERLRAPLRTAVVGRVSTGKSTLLNALLETAVAPTDGRECTKVVHVFRHGQFITASLVSRTGEDRTAVPFDGSRLPSELGRPASEIRYVDVTMPTRQLERATLIDTPGLASADDERADVLTRMKEDTGESAGNADALLYCVKGPLTEDEEKAVQTFRQGDGAKRLTSGTAIGILTRADQTGNDPRVAWKAATTLAADMSRRHADLFATVVPVIGLLAETAATGALREVHARALGTLARAWDPDVTRVALSDKAMFLDEPAPVEPDLRGELLDLLGRYGVTEVLDRLRAGAPAHAAALTKVVRDLSGIDELQRQLQASLGRRADVLKAAGALDSLANGARRAGDHSLHDAAEQLRERPEMFPLKVIEMARLLAYDRVSPPAALRKQAQRTIEFWLNPESPPRPRASRSEVAAAMRDWKQWALLTDLAGRSVAWVMVRDWQLAAEGAAR